MTDSANDSLTFIKNLKVICEVITPDQKDKLLDWSGLDQEYLASIQSFNLNAEDETAIQAKSAITVLLSEQAKLNDLYGQIFIALPDPEEARNQWDAGAERKKREGYISSLQAMQAYSDQEYVQANLDDKRVSDFLSNEPTPPPSGDAVETILRIVNNTPFTLALSATIESSSQWANDKNRPDKNIVNAQTKSGSLIIDAFKDVTLQEDIADGSSSAIYTLDVSATYIEETFEREESDQFTVKIDQVLATKLCTVTPEQAIEQGLPENFSEVESSSSHYVVWMEQPPKDSKTSYLNLYISEKR